MSRRFDTQTVIELNRIKSDPGPLGWEDDAGFPDATKQFTADLLVKKPDNVLQAKMDFIAV
jgi:hypothetical protein